MNPVPIPCPGPVHTTDQRNDKQSLSSIAVMPHIDMLDPASCAVVVLPLCDSIDIRSVWFPVVDAFRTSVATL